MRREGHHDTHTRYTIYTHEYGWIRYVPELYVSISRVF